MRLVIPPSVPLLALLVLAGRAPSAQQGSVAAELKWSFAAGTLPSAPATGEAYGGGVEFLGDLDGDGIGDVAVGLAGTGLHFLDGRIWIQFLNADGSVRAVQAIGEGVGGFLGTLDLFDRFGRAIARLGDLDGDGVVDLAVSAHGDDDGGSVQGAVYILFLNTDGTVKASQKISETTGGLGPVLDPDDNFGNGLAGLGDLDGDGTPDLLVSSPNDDDGGPNRGAVYVLFLNANGTVKASQKISSTAGMFSGPLDNNDLFGLDAVTNLGDLDGNGLIEVAVGAPNDDDGGLDRGAVWILELSSTGEVSSSSKISQTSGGFSGSLADVDNFGAAIGCVGDVSGDGVNDLIVGAYGDDGGGSNRGAVWLLFLEPDGSVGFQEEIGDGLGGFGGALDDADLFGIDLSVIEDLDGNGLPEIVVGSFQDDDDAVDAGACWILYLERCQPAAATAVRNAGTNPASYAAGLPRLHQTWSATVDLSTTGHAFAIVFGFDSPLQLALSGGQTLLAFDGFGSGELLGFPLQAGPIAPFQANVPYNPALCGATIHTQAIHFGGVVPFALSNAVDLSIGI